MIISKPHITATWVRLLVLFLIINSLMIVIVYIVNSSSTRELLSINGVTLPVLSLGWATYTIPVFIDSLTNYTHQISVFPENPLLHSFSHYYFSDLDIHNSSNYFHNNDNINMYICRLLSWMLSASIEHIICSYYPLNTWIGALDSSPEVIAIHNIGERMIEVIAELDEMDKKNIYHGEDYIKYIENLDLERLAASAELESKKAILALKKQVTPLLTSLLTFSISSILENSIFSDSFIYTKDVILKLTSFIDHFKEQHNICLNLMNPFTTLMSEGYLNLSLSLDQLKEIHEIINTLLVTIENLNNTEVAELANKLDKNPHYWKFEVGLTLFTTLYKLIITSAGQVSHIICHNEDSNLVYSTINKLLSSTTVDISNEKMHLIEKIKNDIVVVRDLITSMLVSHENNVVQVINNIIVNLNLANYSKCYNGYFSNYNFLITVISTINEETSYACNTYIPAAVELSTKLWYHLVCVYTILYVCLLCLPLLFIFMCLLAKNLRSYLAALYVKRY